MRSKLLRFQGVVAVLALACLATACSSEQDDAALYAAEFLPDESGHVREGEPQYELAVVIEDRGGKLMAFPPAPADKAGQKYSPDESRALSLVGPNFDKDTNRYYALSALDSPVATVDPHRAFSPYKSNGKYNELDVGLPFDRAAKKSVRVIPKELPCWRCGGLKFLVIGEEMDECPECDDNGFVIYEGARVLDENPDSRELSKRKPSKRSSS